MPTIKVRGSIWPIGGLVTLPELLFTMTDRGTRLDTTFSCKCVDSVVTIECDAPAMIEDDPESIGFVVANARMLFEGAISLASVHSGRSHKFIVDDIDLGSEARQLNIEYAHLTGLITAFSPDEFASTMSWITADIQVLLILQDLNSAMSEPFYTLVGCGRAIDGLRHAIAGPEGDAEVKKWPELRTALNVDKTYVQAITAAGTKARHGQRLSNYGHNNFEIMRRSWILFNRFLNYRKRNNEPLTAPEFPLLTD